VKPNAQRLNTPRPAGRPGKRRRTPFRHGAFSAKGARSRTRTARIEIDTRKACAYPFPERAHGIGATGPGLSARDVEPITSRVALHPIAETGGRHDGCERAAAAVPERGKGFEKLAAQCVCLFDRIAKFKK
jgi:hypothetical protein